jgi:hypothetical protein
MQAPRNGDVDSGAGNPAGHSQVRRVTPAHFGWPAFGTVVTNLGMLNL